MFFDLIQFLLFQAMNVAAGIFVNIVDVAFDEELFVLFDDICLDVVLSVKPDGSIGSTRTAAHFQ